MAKTQVSRGDPHQVRDEQVLSPCPHPQPSLRVGARARVPALCVQFAVTSREAAVSPPESGAPARFSLDMCTQLTFTVRAGHGRVSILSRDCGRAHRGRGLLRNLESQGGGEKSHCLQIIRLE